MTIYTKDKLTEILIDQVKKNITAFDGVREALNKINDQNTLHFSKEDAKQEVIKSLVDGNEKFYKLISYILLLLVASIIILAGAEKVFQFIPKL